MKYKIWKKLAIGLSAAMATSIPAVFITSCGVKPQPKPEPQYIETKFFDEEKILKYYNKTKYLNWEIGEIHDDYKCQFVVRLDLGHHLHLDYNKPNPKGIVLIETDPSTRWEIKFSPDVYNVKTPHEKIDIFISDDVYDFDAKGYHYQHITIPAYDGMGKSIGNWKPQGSVSYFYPWECYMFDRDHSLFQCNGPSHYNAQDRQHYEHITEDVLCSTRIISLPANTTKIADDAFNILVSKQLQGFQKGDGIRPACSPKFHEYVFGTREHPETGLWQHLVFEGETIPYENIGDKAFYRCWSLEKDLAKYYGQEKAHFMVTWGF